MDLFPRITEHLAAQYAKDYDAQAGRAGFVAWLGKHTGQATAGPMRRSAEQPDVPEPQSVPAMAEDIPSGPDRAIRQRTRTQLRRRLLKVLERQRVSRRAAFTALVAEDRHIGTGRDPMMSTHGETLVRAAGKAQADAQLARSQQRLDRLARRIDRLRAQQATLLIRAAHLQSDLVPHPDGGQETVADVLRAQASLRAQITDEVAQGSRKHHRLPRWLRHLPRVVLLADFSLLLYFMAGITNADWARPVSASFAFAILIAATVTMLSYGLLSFTGNRLRAHKDHSGTIPFGLLDGFTKTTCWFAGANIAVIAAMMFIRMRSEVLYTLGPHAWATALVIALALAVPGALANFLIIAINAFDGSDQVARLDSMSAATSGLLSREQRMREKAALITARITVPQRRAHRAAAQDVTRAGRHISAADRIIDAARAIHQSAGPYSEPPSDPNTLDQVTGYRDDQSAPRVDLRAIRMALEHIGDTRADAEQESSSPETVPESAEENTPLRWSASCG
jgi:hypothetical protein